MNYSRLRLQDFNSSVGLAHFSLMAVQVFFNGFAYYIRLLAVEDAPALGNVLPQPIIQLGTELHLDFRHTFHKRALVVLIGDFSKEACLAPFRFFNPLKMQNCRRVLVLL